MKNIKFTFSSFTTILLCTCLMSCGALLKGCAKYADDVAKHADDVARHADDVATHSDDVARAVERSEAVTANAEVVAAKINEFRKNSDGTYTYRGYIYNKFDDIPFEQATNLYVNDVVTSEEAAHLIARKVKFVHNKKAFMDQQKKSYKVVFLISDEVDVTKNLYDLDDENAKLLIKYASEINQVSRVQRASSYDEVLKFEREIIENGEIPVVVFHNNVKAASFMQLNRKTNIITCNSFTVNPEAFLTSTDLLDMRAVIEGVNSAVNNSTLSEFYNNFTAIYYSHMARHHQKQTLIYFGIGTAFIGSVGLTAYYSQSES
ncbi:hypothetical protein MTO98_02850 [Mucilaginibacter sp. SMC90]|uniref:hypothetical protein n=1 Tax=Mucilaginibacter sp. SMC90 TaxID=2929803 RepID=UPI001FB4E8B3|nr:hypothetical protein [Mucilaginibacter sp. SMC90]UOE50009.1 hypothetical protein MTO98_02850 [Mucilaginibacter sp. SMC90]